MKKIMSRLAVLTGAALMLCLSNTTLTAQDRPGRGNFDPEQFRQRMMENFRERLEVKDDAEWKIIQERIDKVMEVRRELGPGGMGGFGFGRPPRGGGEDRAAGQQGGQGERRRRGPGFGPEPSPEAEALEKALESKASADEVKQKLAKLREVRKQKEQELDKAQESLREVLSVRQEAQAVLMGLLK